MQAQPRLDELGAGGLRWAGAGRPAPGLRVPGQPEALAAVRAEEQDLYDVALVAQDLVDPARVARARQVRLVLVARPAQYQPWLRQLGEEADHLVAARQVLVEVAKVRPQVLKIGLLVEECGAVQDQRQVDHHRQQQRREGKDQQDQEDQVAQFHARGHRVGKTRHHSERGGKWEGRGRAASGEPLAVSPYLSASGWSSEAAVPTPTMIPMLGTTHAQVRILYQDDHLVAVDKPPGLLVHRTRLAADEDDALLQRLRDALGRYVYAVHRLDRPTSGVVVFGLTPEVGRRLSLLFETRRVAKGYLAVVRGYLGTPETPDGVIDYPLRDAPDLPLRSALTAYRTLARVELPHAIGRYPVSRYSLLAVQPQTGRTHQIRRHFHHVFHPIVGDTTHGEGRHNRLFRECYGCGRLLLHAVSLVFDHPCTATPLRIEAAPDADWQALMGRLGWGKATGSGGHLSP